MIFKNHALRLTAMLVLGIGIFINSATHAEKITPNHVFQVTENILSQLNRMHDANLTKPDLSKARLEIPKRLPRHVIQQAINVRLKIQTLKRVNGIEPVEISPPPVREVTPGDVMEVAKTILDELVGFDKAYGLEPFKETAKLPQDKTPTDVYINLLKSEAMIVQLGIPGTVPNEVYTNAVAVTQELETIRVAMGKVTPVDPPSPAIGKKPKDAYTLAYYALKGIEGLSKKKEYTIPNGVIVPEKLSKNIGPADVQQLLLYILAELSSMKVAVQSTEKLILPPAASGQTPSTVFDQLGLANRQIQSMQW